jgi:hypothetical protein
MQRFFGVFGSFQKQLAIHRELLLIVVERLMKKLLKNES